VSAPLLSLRVLTVLIRWTRSGGADAGAPAARCDALVYAWSDFVLALSACAHYTLCSYSVLYPICALPALFTTCIRYVHTPFTTRSAHYLLRSLYAPLTIRSDHSLSTYYPLFSLPDLCTIRSAHYMFESALPTNHSISRTSVFR
jgi:hypothetical protein